MHRYFPLVSPNASPFLVYHSPSFPQTAGCPRQIHANESYQTFDIVLIMNLFLLFRTKKKGLVHRVMFVEFWLIKGYIFYFQGIHAHTYIVMRVYIRIQTFVVLKISGLFSFSEIRIKRPSSSLSNGFVKTGVSL